MSMTYDLLCKTCGQSLWVGQSTWIYKGEKNLKALESFLFTHLAHELEFTSEDCQDTVYKYFDEVEWLKYIEKKVRKLKQPTQGSKEAK